jgi:hypothetical protein
LAVGRLATASPARVRREAKQHDGNARQMREQKIFLDRSRSRKIGIIPIRRMIDLWSTLRRPQAPAPTSVGLANAARAARRQSPPIPIHHETSSRRIGISPRNGGRLRGRGSKKGLDPCPEKVTVRKDLPPRYRGIGRPDGAELWPVIGTILPLLCPFGVTRPCSM